MFNQNSMHMFSVWVTLLQRQKKNEVVRDSQREREREKESERKRASERKRTREREREKEACHCCCRFKMHFTECKTEDKMLINNPNLRIIYCIAIHMNEAHLQIR